VRPLFLWWGVPLFVCAPLWEWVKLKILQHNSHFSFHHDGYVSDCTYNIIKYFFFFPLQNNNFSYKIEGCSS